MAAQTMRILEESVKIVLLLGLSTLMLLTNEEHQKSYVVACTI